MNYLSTQRIPRVQVVFRFVKKAILPKRISHIYMNMKNYSIESRHSAEYVRIWLTVTK